MSNTAKTAITWITIILIETAAMYGMANALARSAVAEVDARHSMHNSERKVQ